MGYFDDEPSGSEEGCELDYVQECFDIAKEHGLQTEFIASSIDAMRENNELSISQACDIGLGEWVK